MGGDTVLLQRMDWEQEPPEEYSDGWVTEKALPGLCGLEKKLKDDFENLDAIVVKDLCKGVVNKVFIEWLADKYKNVPWFISTKAWDPPVGDGDLDRTKYIDEWCPDWLGLIKNVNVRLLIVPQIPANICIHSGKLGCWLTRNGRVSKEAQTLIDGYQNLFLKSEKLLTVVLPDALSAVAVERSGTDRKCKYEFDIERISAPIEITAGLPMASIFLSSIVHSLLTKEDIDLKERIRESLAFTIHWMTYESRSLPNGNLTESRE